jgi:putative ribosome biogenesis GTPase RsgA
VFSSLSWLLVSEQAIIDLFLADFSVFLGASGTGRTTFVNTLCESEVLAHKISDNPETAHAEEGIRIKPVNVGTWIAVNYRPVYPSFPPRT